MDPVVHFELPAADLARARKFYGSVFGWNLQEWPMPDGSMYVGIHTTPIDEKTRAPLKPGAINGGMMLKTKEVTSPIIAMQVDSVDERIVQVKKAGGKVVKPKTDILGMGFYAYVQDTEGNVIGLWEDLKKA